MQRPATEPDQQAEIAAAAPRNLLVLAAQQVVLRIAWIFKTESVIMPAFLDTIAGAGWIRGCLPVLNRIGQSVPPMLMAERLRAAPVKSRALRLTSLAMSGPFLLLAGIWFLLDEKRQPWLPALFLLLYFVFFCFTGLNQLSFGTVQGKLIEARRRGRLLAISGVISSVGAIASAWHWLPILLKRSDGFGWIFVISGVGFSVSGVVCLLLREPEDAVDGEGRAAGRMLHGVWSVVRRDVAFRRLAVVAMLFITAQLLFPHYQRLGRDRLDAGSFDLMVWVVSQNAGAGIFSLLAGAVADRLGNRLAIRLLVLSSALTPLLALVLTTDAAVDRFGRSAFWLTFFSLGLIPVTLKALVNYALEISAHDDHPRYVSTLSLCLALPFSLSPLVGLLVDVVGFSAVLLAVGLMIALGGLLTFRMFEPRHAGS